MLIVGAGMTRDFSRRGSSADDKSGRKTFTDARDRQATRLQVDLGGSGSVSVLPQRRGDAALDVLPDGTDAGCVVELRACTSCWIDLGATIDRYDDAQEVAAGVEDDRSTMTENNASESNTVACRLWLV